MTLLNVTEERPDQAIRELLTAVISAAESEFSPLRYEGEYPTDGIGVQELRPRAVGITNDYWQMTVTTSFANWINDTAGVDHFDVITGVFNLTIDPAVTALFPAANGKNLPYAHIESLYTYKEPRGWFNKPFARRPSNSMTIQAIGRIAQTERLGLLGYSVAKRSFLITASP